ncbi:fibrillin-2 [Ceratitis capitata]|uniref:(Mediterranean fruit fly) hypothetical protein n=1 Tax=Ceratitis capitata TaxID=7213 RepID=W8BPS8_CERCA|nr:fibrillin-2 [Ceratitis capitata]CAD6997412.1 unnamed protein product [Ceratitis capitata]
MSIVKLIVIITVIVPITQVVAGNYCTKRDEHGNQVRYCCTGSKGDGWNCEFICDNDCENGTCIAPQRCVCNKGFKNSAGPRSSCVPIESVLQPRICSQHCRNGTCVEGLCTCAPGWTLQASASGDICIPQCVKTVGNVTHGCINGYCVAPGACMCNEGYELLPNNEFECTINPVANDHYLKRKLVEIWKDYFWLVIGAAVLLILLFACCCRLCWKCYLNFAKAKSHKDSRKDCIEENCQPLV